MSTTFDISERRPAILVTLFEPFDLSDEMADIRSMIHSAWLTLRSRELFVIINLRNIDVTAERVQTILHRLEDLNSNRRYEVTPLMVTDPKDMKLLNKALRDSRVEQTLIFDGLDDAYSFIDEENVQLGAMMPKADEGDF